MARVVIAALLAAAVIVLYWAALFVWQRSVLFPAPPLAGATAPPADAERVWLDADGNRVEAWFLPPLARRDDAAPLLIFLHGNAELIDYWPAEFVTPRRWGMGVLLVEYPGYGRSGGRPSQRSVVAAAVAGHSWATARADVDPARIVAYGRSLGGGAATQLAAARPLAGLILESSFTGVHAFARRLGAPRFLVRDRFDNLAALPGLTLPILIVHGSGDRIVPVEHAHALHAAQPAAELVLLPCGHNDCPMPWAPIERFLRRHAVIAPAPTP